MRFAAILDYMGYGGTGLVCRISLVFLRAIFFQRIAPRQILLNRNCCKGAWPQLLLSRIPDFFFLEEP
jgi:hypothetical protein